MHALFITVVCILYNIHLRSDAFLCVQVMPGAWWALTLTGPPVQQHVRWANTIARTQAKLVAENKIGWTGEWLATITARQADRDRALHEHIRVRIVFILFRHFPAVVHCKVIRRIYRAD